MPSSRLHCCASHVPCAALCHSSLLPRFTVPSLQLWLTTVNHRVMSCTTLVLLHANAKIEVGPTANPTAADWCPAGELSRLRICGPVER